ncbi:FixH family protein [Aliikangiella sp. IMCC44359]|uniref:FixH family protein n=1 Tax=Aliikangiella sp. IMCC44359 TaxID=3459125 RepID=UPI00403AC22E
MKQIIKTLILTFTLSYSSIILTQNKTPSINQDLLQSVEYLEQANQAKEKSREIILNANAIRQQLKKLRANKTASKNQISELVKQLEESQKQGAELRNKSVQLTQQATKSFEKGFITLWPNWLENHEPLTMDDSVKSFFAHNAKIRSVHKNLLNKTQTPMENITDQRKDMSLQIPALIEQNAPPDLNISAFKFSRQQQYFAHIEVHSEAVNNNNVAAVPLNKIHQWRLLVSDLKGQPLENAKIKIEGHMPGHVHGLPTAPQVTHEIAPGVYIVDGMKFQMKGWWVIKFILPTSDSNPDSSSPDFFTFNLVL